jgi:hypothetical protein
MELRNFVLAARRRKVIDNGDGILRGEKQPLQRVVGGMPACW